MVVVGAIKALDPDCQWWHPVEVSIWKEKNRIPVDYGYQEPRRDINDGWLFDVATHEEKNGRELGEVLEQISEIPGTYRVQFKSRILTVVYRIRTQVQIGYENTEEKPIEMVIQTVELKGIGLQLYLDCRKLDKIGRIQVDGKSQTIFDFFRENNRPELVYSGSML